MSHELLVVSTYVVWALLVLVLLALFALYRHFGQLYVNSTTAKLAQGPDIGSSLLSVGGADVLGNEFELPTSKVTLLLFADTRCDLCASIRDGLRALEPRRDLVDIFVLCGGAPRDVLAWCRRTPSFVRVVHDRKGSLANRFAVNGTPFAVGATADGVVRWKGIVNTAEALGSVSDELLVGSPPDHGTLSSLELIADNALNDGKVT